MTDILNAHLPRGWLDPNAAVLEDMTMAQIIRARVPNHHRAAAASRMDELARLDAALARGRQEIRDRTGPLGALLPPPVLAAKAPRIPRLRPVIRFDLWDDVIEPLVMLGVRPEPTTRQLLRRRERSTDRALYACIGTYIGLSILTFVIGVT